MFQLDRGKCSAPPCHACSAHSQSPYTLAHPGIPQSHPDKPLPTPYLLCCFDEILNRIPGSCCIQPLQLAPPTQRPPQAPASSSSLVEQQLTAAAAQQHPQRICCCRQDLHRVRSVYKCRSTWVSSSVAQETQQIHRVVVKLLRLLLT
jgi:hypothetical protein